MMRVLPGNTICRRDRRRASTGVPRTNSGRGYLRAPAVTAVVYHGGSDCVCWSPSMLYCWIARLERENVQYGTPTAGWGRMDHRTAQKPEGTTQPPGHTHDKPGYVPSMLQTPARL